MADSPTDLGLRTDPGDQIAREVLRVHEEAYGVGAGNVEVHMLGDLVIVLLDELQLSISEQTLLSEGREEVVTNIRSAFQQAIGPTFTAIVERATGRRVSAFLSNTSLAPLFSVEIFKLAPSKT